MRRDVQEASDVLNWAHIKNGRVSLWFCYKDGFRKELDMTTIHFLFACVQRGRRRVHLYNTFQVMYCLTFCPGHK